MGKHFHSTEAPNRREPCVICKGPATVEQIDSNVGVLESVMCADPDCNGHWNNGWFEELEDAERTWNNRQIGEAAMSAVLPLTPNQEPHQ